ncbi:hypothetical protein JCM11641_004637 [Rhodosporidiobolus odoratus]
MSSNTATTTTTTHHWVLEKYSRSRMPVDRPAKRIKLAEEVRGGTKVKGLGEGEIEWDHYTQPQLSLRLKTTFLASSNDSASIAGSHHVQSMLLSITFDPLFREPDRANQHITLDLLDLASFSSAAVRSATPADQLPLKAVYKDAVLGLRYLSLEAGDSQFKRLQVKFTSTGERERFVEATGGLLPSKPAVETGTDGKKRVAKSTTPRKSKSGAPSVSQTPRRSTAVPTTPALLSSTAPTAEGPQHHDRTRAYPQLSISGTRTSIPSLPNTYLALGSALPTPVQPASQSSNHSPSGPPPLPRNLSALLPNLAVAPEAPCEPPYLPTTLTPSQELAHLSPTAFDQLLQEALLEEGFEELVERVQATLAG